MRSAVDASRLPAVPGARVAVVRSKWYGDLTASLSDTFVSAIRSAGCDDPTVHVVPGCWEIPLAVRTLVRADPALDAVAVFGVIVKGDTYHFDMIVSECTRGLGRVMHEEDVPVIMEILPVPDLETARARCGGDGFNKGYEAAAAAAEIIAWRRAVGPARKEREP